MSNLEQLLGQLQTEPMGEEVNLADLEGERSRRWRRRSRATTSSGCP